jgi:hypothetical protein
MAPSASPAQAVQQGVLQALYALFLGGIITAFLVVGLNTFYPPPDVNEEQLAALEERELEVLDCPPEAVECDLTAAERAQLRALEAEREALWEERDEAQRSWSRIAGVLLIGLATLLLALSLIRWDRAIVLSNGLLLGGLFTMVGGIGLTIAGGEGIDRFLVLTMALGITVGLGYLRFARRAEPVQEVGASLVDSDLADRVAALEQRLDEARRALGG